MYEFRMLNRRPLELPPLETDVPMVEITYRTLTAPQARAALKHLPNLLYNKYSGWHFFLSSDSVGKLTNEIYEEAHLTTIHLSAIANLDTLVRNAVLGYTKPEPASRINSAGKEVSGNKRIKFNHRFYVGAWIDNKPYSVRMLVKEYVDGAVVLGEEAKAYALHIKEMRGIVTCTSEFPASHGVTRPSVTHLSLKNDMPGISIPSPRCEPAPPTDIPLTGTKIVQGERKCKSFCNLPNRSLSSDERQCREIPLLFLIESNLKDGEETLYRERAQFDYSKTGTDSLETIFDRMGLRPEQRTAIYNGDKIVVSGVRLHNAKTDIILQLGHGELTYWEYKP
ncbi:MAG: hypothetical protein K2K51_02140 [Bacteroidales bacterium]|nr:hypothetical protein [Bacteroidales bacterium]